jgi:hypothetical protein
MSTRIPWLLIPLLIAGASGVYAEEPVPTEPEAKRRQVLSGGSVQPSRDETPLEEEASDRPAWTQRIHIAKKYGFELRQPVRVGDHRLSFRVKGPVMKRKRLGLTFEVRF